MQKRIKTISTVFRVGFGFYCRVPRPRSEKNYSKTTYKNESFIIGIVLKKKTIILQKSNHEACSLFVFEKTAGHV